MQLWPWEDASLDEMELAYRRMRAMFEFLDKLGVDYWCFHDRCSTPAALSCRSSAALHSDEPCFGVSARIDSPYDALQMTARHC